MTKRLTVLSYCKVKSAGSILIDTILLKEIKTAFTCLEPFVLYAVNVTKVAENPAATALHPYALISRENLTVLIKAGINTAVLFIHTVFEPEISNISKLLLYPFSFFFKIHIIPPLN